jgi:serine/threonine protein kinase
MFAINQQAIVSNDDNQSSYVSYDDPRLISCMVFSGDLRGEGAVKPVFVKVLDMIRRVDGDKLICYSDVIIDEDGLAKMVFVKSEFRTDAARPFAPETRNANCSADTITVEQEVFEAGVLLFHMVTGVMPFAEASYKDWWYKSIMNGEVAKFWSVFEYRNRYSAEFKDLFMRMVDPSPRRRITLSEIENHPWM